MTGRPHGFGAGRPSRRTTRSAPQPDGVPLTQGAGSGPGEDPPGDPESVARAICLRALTGAPKTRAQLAELLERRGVPEEAAVAVLDRLGEVGLVDDAAFARAWVSSRQAGRGLARRALAAELRAKGVDDGLAAEAAAQVDDEDERAAARRLVERRLPGMRRLDSATATRRLMGMLARRGYGAGLSASVVRAALEADRGGDAADAAAWEVDQLLP